MMYLHLVCAALHMKDDGYTMRLSSHITQMNAMILVIT